MPCGRTLVKMSKITGRRDDMLVIRGVNVYPSEVERVLLGEAALSPDYLLVVDERGDAARTGWRCASTGRGRRAGRARTSWRRGCARSWGCGVGVRVLPAGGVPRTEVGKAVRVVRWRRASRRCQGWSDLG